MFTGCQHLEINTSWRHFMTDPKKDNSVKIVVNRETEHELDQFGVKLEGSGVDAVSTAEAEDVEAVICSYPYMSLFEDDVRCVWFRHLSSPSCSLRPAKN